MAGWFRLIGRWNIAIDEKNFLIKTVRGGTHKAWEIHMIGAGLKHTCIITLCGAGASYFRWLIQQRRVFSWSSAAQTSIFWGSSPSFLSFSKIRKTPSSFSPSRAPAYHQKADQDRVTHAYTIGQEMTVSESTVKASLINVGMMKAKLSLKGILNQWHLNCLCWDRFQKSRTLSNMLGRISHSSDFLSRVNNTICRDIFIHWQSLLSSLPPLTHIMYTLISISPPEAPPIEPWRAIPSVAAGVAVAAVQSTRHTTGKWS